MSELLQPIEKLERDLRLHEGGRVQLMIDRRVIWFTARAYGTCYLGLDEAALAHLHATVLKSRQSRFDLADLERLSRF